MDADIPSSYAKSISRSGVDKEAISMIDVINPSTGEKIPTVPDASAADVDRVVATARASFENKLWRRKDSSEKERILWRFADILEANKEEMARIESSENGKTIREA